jgi:hypothetical protein
MRLLKQKIDSRLLKLSIFEIIDFEDEYQCFPEFEKTVIGKETPDIIQIKINSTDYRILRFFEDHGFRFSEFKIARSLNLNKTSGFFSNKYPFKCCLINTPLQLNTIIEFAKRKSFDDRFTNNYEIPNDLSLKRNIEFLKKSYKSNDENIIGILNQNNGTIISFQSFRVLNKNSILLYLDGFNPEFEYLKDKFNSDFHKWFYENGFFIINAFSSGNNIEELNNSINEKGFIINSTFLILEKLYSNKSKSK